MVENINYKTPLDKIAGHHPNDETKAMGPSNYFLNEKIKPLADVEKAAIQHAIHLCDGNIPKAATFLDVAPSTIYRKVKEWGKNPCKNE